MKQLILVVYMLILVGLVNVVEYLARFWVSRTVRWVDVHLVIFGISCLRVFVCVCVRLYAHGPTTGNWYDPLVDVYVQIPSKLALKHHRQSVQLEYYELLISIIHFLKYYIDVWLAVWSHFPPLLKCWDLIFKFYHSKNMNKTLKFGHNMIH